MIPCGVLISNLRRFVDIYNSKSWAYKIRWQSRIQIVLFKFKIDPTLIENPFKILSTICALSRISWFYKIFFRCSFSLIYQIAEALVLYVPIIMWFLYYNFVLCKRFGWIIFHSYSIFAFLLSIISRSAIYFSSIRNVALMIHELKKWKWLPVQHHEVVQPQ